MPLVKVDSTITLQVHEINFQNNFPCNRYSNVWQYIFGLSSKKFSNTKIFGNSLESRQNVRIYALNKNVLRI